jgi:N-acetylglutamate synthase-like GNAT family acetyltransferase
MIYIKSPQTKEEFKTYYALRYSILREPLGQPKGTEKDDYEPISYHFMAFDDSVGEVVGAAKLFEREPSIGQFSHMAVAEAYQKKGVGGLLLEAIEKKARELGYKSIGTATRINTTGFYEKYGYKVIGKANVLFGKIQLLWMEKELN